MEDDNAASQPEPLNYAGPDTGRLVAVARFPQEWMAAVAVTKLQAEGIVAEVTDFMPSHGLGARPAVVAVQNDQLDDAIAVLAETPARQYLLPKK